MRSMLRVSKRARQMIFLLIALISIAALISVLLIEPSSPLRTQTEQPPIFHSHHYYGLPTTGYSMHCGIPIGNSSYIFAGGMVLYDENGRKESFIDRINSTDDFSNKNRAIELEPYNDSKIGMNVSPSSINDIKQTKDNGYIAVGNALTGNGTWSYFYMAKMNQSLAPEPDWQKAYLPGEGLSVIQTLDGGYAAVGCDYGNNNIEHYYILKTDQYGNEMWNHSIADGKFTVIKQMKDGSIVVGGYARYTVSPHMSGCIDAFDVAGHSLPIPRPVNATFGFGPHEMDANVNDLYEASDHNIWAVGAVKQDDNHSSGWLFKINSTLFTGHTRIGQVSFPNGTREMFYKFENNLYNNFTSIDKTDDGGFVIGGQTGNGSGSNASNSILLLKIDCKGNIVWAKSYNLDLLLQYKTSSRLASVRQIGHDEYFFTATSYDSNVDFQKDSNGAEWGVLLKTPAAPLPDILTPINQWMVLIIPGLIISAFGIFFNIYLKPGTDKRETRQSDATTGHGTSAPSSLTTVPESAAPAEIGEYMDHGILNENTIKAVENNLNSLKLQLEMSEKRISQLQSDMGFLRQEYGKAKETLNKLLISRPRKSIWNRLRGKNK